MKSIISVIMTVTLLLSALTACGTSRMARVEEASATPSPMVNNTQRPDTKGANSRTGTGSGSAVNGANDDTGVGGAVGNAVGSVGNAVGDVVGGVGSAIEDAGNAMGDMANGRVTDNDGVIGNERSGARR